MQPIAGREVLRAGSVPSLPLDNAWHQAAAELELLGFRVKLVM